MPDTPSRGRRRCHVWVDGADQTLMPGLIVEWRRNQAAAWEALLATPGGRGGGILLYVNSSRIHSGLCGPTQPVMLLCKVHCYA